jgi:hypothetical protein
VGKLDIIGAVLLGSAALFHELFASAAIFFVFGLIVVDQAKQTRTQSIVKNFAIAVPIWLASAFVVLAPGNFRRAAISDYGGHSSVGTMISNMDAIGSYLKSHASHPILFIIAWSVAVIVLSGRAGKSLGKWSVGTVLLWILTIILVSKASWNLALVLLLTTLIYISILEVRAENAPPTLVGCIFASAGSLLPLMAAPTVPGRALIPFFLLLMPVAAFAFTRVAIVLRTQASVGAALIASLIALAVFAAPSTIRIYKGYSANRAQNEYNDALLEVTSAQIAAWEINVPVKLRLQKLKYDEFGEVMPYQRPLIEYWLRRYYSLPSNVIFEWIPAP